jgi:hypothetical protein
LTIVAIFEATMSHEQAEQLAALMREARPTRPAKVGVEPAWRVVDVLEPG